jgi:hypothetical protein
MFRIGLPLHIVDMLRWLWRYRFGLGAVREGRHISLRRFAASNSLLASDKAPDQRPDCWSGRLAGKQPPLEQHVVELQGHTALPSTHDAQMPPARRRYGCVEARASPQVAARNRGVARYCQEGTFEYLTHPRIALNSCEMSGIGRLKRKSTFIAKGRILGFD